MMKRLIPLFLCSLFSLALAAADGDWSVSKIDPKLLKNANMIVRMTEEQVTIKNTHEVIYRNHYVFTILNENADAYAQCAVPYDKLIEVESISGTLFDMNGRELHSLKNKDIQDVSGVSDNNLIDDSRLKLHNFYYKVYPYTVEYDIVTKLKTTFFLPNWAPQPAEKIAVENSSMTYIVPENYNLRFKPFHYSAMPVTGSVNGNKTFLWSVRSVPAILREPYQPPMHEITTYISFAPSDFEMAGYKGNMETWRSFGLFISQLNKGRDQLPDAVKQKVHSLTDGVTDPFKKISLLYEYMQQNTRYISIQLGVGGLQPFDAAYVATKGYGDCKALSNYMFSLLKEAGIHSCYTVIKSGKNGRMPNPDFASDQFDHIILCVPGQQDTVWLECTSQTNPAGYLGDFTCDRDAILVDEDGGKLVHTPVYSIDENLEERKVDAVLSDDGSLALRSRTLYGGLQQDLYHQLIHELSKDKVKEYLHEQLDFATYDISNFDYVETSSAHPTVKEALDINVSNYATITGKRLFIIPNVMTRSHRKLMTDTTRQYDMVLGYAYRDVDTVSITLPAGYTAESIPADISVKTIFGTYACSVKLNGTLLQYIRRIDFFGGRFPAAEYNNLVKFYEVIYKADRNKVVLVKNATN